MEFEKYLAEKLKKPEFKAAYEEEGRRFGMKKYLAYGANLDVNTMARRCPNAELLWTGYLDGWRLMFKGEMPNSYATIEKWEGYKVPYALWSLTEADEKALDRYEGYPNHYLKGTLEFEGVEAMYYYKHPEQPTRPPNMHYYEAIEKAYDYHGFDKTILGAAMDFSDFKAWERK